MCLERSNRGIKRKFIYNILILLFISLVGIIGGIVLCSKLGIFHLSEMENREKIESKDWGDYMNYKNEEKMDNDIEAESNIQGEEGLREILVNIHKDYISKQWFGEEKYGIPNNYYENRISYGASDLENVIFYMDNKETIYFIPTSMVNKTICLNGKEINVNECEEDGKLNLYLYRYEIYSPEPQRVIYPEPDKHISILSYEVQDFISELDYLGTISMNFPKSVPEGVGKLYENEYTDAVVKLIHSFLFDYKKYGNYLIYIGNYRYSDLVYEKEKYDYNISITVAIVGEETSYWWEFHAKEGLGENGEVILESDGGDSYSGPGNYDQQNGAYASDIDSIIHANRLVIPLLVTENDKVEKIEIRRNERNVILLIKNWQVDLADQICQTDYTRMNYKDGYYYYQSSADHFYLYKSDGKRSECLAKQVPKEIYLNNNWIYFTNASDGQTLYKICTDGSGMKQVLDQKIDRFILLEDAVYYISGVDGYLYSWQEEAGSRLLYQGNCSWVNTDRKLLYVRERKSLENKDDAIVTMDKYGNILSCFDIDGYNMIPTDQVLYYLKDNYIVCAMPENGVRIGNIEIPVKTVTESALDFEIWEDNIYVLSYEPEEAYAIYQYEISSCTWDTLCVQKLENSSWDYRGFHDFHIKNGKIFIKEWIAEGKGELWQQIDIKSGRKEMFEDMEYPCNVKVSDGYMLTGVAACSETYLAEDYTYNKDEEDGEGNLIKTNIVLPQLNEKIKAYREINSKIKQEADGFYRERIEFAEYIKDAAVEWENESYGNWGYIYVYADASYVSIVYWKFIGRNGLNDIKDDHYEVRLYSSATGEELNVDDLFDMSRDEVLLEFSYAIRKTDEGLRMFWDDLECLDSDYRKIYYLLTEEGVVIRIVESMRTKVTDFTIGYDEISFI